MTPRCRRLVLCCVLGSVWALALPQADAQAQAQDAAGLASPDTPVTPDTATPVPPADTATPPQPDPPTEPPLAPPAEQLAEQLVVRELSVFVLDHFGENANNDQDYGSTLLNGAYRRRRPATGENATAPMPLSFITFDGTLDTPRTVRVELAPDTEDSQFLGHWPKTQSSAHAIAWPDLDDAPPALRSASIAADHWLVPLRTNADRARVASRGNADRFLAYDPMLPMHPPVRITPAIDTRLSVRPNADFGDYRGEVLLIEQSGLGVAWVWAKVGPEEQPSVGLGLIKSNGKPLETLRPRLQAHGFNDAEIDVALAIVQRLALDSWGMAAVCLIDKPTMDAMLPLTIEPAADRVERVGLVVLTNIDPDINRTVGQYLAQLASDEWAVRDAAQRALIDLGHAAIEQVQAQRNSKDPEVAYRVQQILDAYVLRYGDPQQRQEQ